MKGFGTNCVSLKTNFYWIDSWAKREILSYNHKFMGFQTKFRGFFGS